MITQFIIVIVSILFGWVLHSFKTENAKDIKQEIKHKVFGNKSKVVEWTPPLSDEELAEKEVRKNLNK